MRLRDRIQEATGGAREPQSQSDRPIWMAEDFKQVACDSTLSKFQQAEFCLEGVRRAECFVAIITRRHGTPITVEDVGEVSTSFFEAELFEAALLGKPSFIYLLKDYEPEGKLASLLKLLKPAFPNMNLTPHSEDDILRSLERLVRYFQRPRWLRRIVSPPRLKMMVDTQFSLRHHPYDPKSSPPPLRFLDNGLDPNMIRPEPNQVVTLLERAGAEESHQVRLTLIWFAIRELMGAPFQKPAFHESLPLWERAFSMWISSGAWYGLHSHFPMSCLAALGSLADIRARSDHTADPTHSLPHGPLASEYYSIGKLAGRAEEILDLALTHIQLAIDSNHGNTANQTAIRASILLRMGHSDAALKDYRHVAELRKGHGEPAYGEALSEWGYALMKTGERHQGVVQMERGLELLKSSSPSGFQIRAMRKLAEGYARCWKISAALTLASEAYDLAEGIGARDQIHSLQRLANYLVKK